MENGDIKNQYLYGALNRLEQAVNGKGEAAAYEYNGLGHRVGKASGAMEGIAGMQNGPSDAILKWTDVMDPLSRLKEQTINPETRIEYTIDLTRQYHNLLQKEEDGNTQSYLWDGNVAGMREDRGTASHYYFQDELGSPVRLMDQNGELAESYGYDEFGQDLYRDREKTAGRSMTGSLQPFGYTGYQYDRTAGTYYAQAREYRAELGRFAAVDTIKGFTMAPYTLNEYGYCWNNPMVLVDLDGKFPSLSDIGNSIKSAASSVVNTVTDIVDKAVETVKDVADKTIETVKNVASDIKGAATEFYNEHKVIINGVLVIAGAAAVTALTVTTFGAGGVITAAVVGASVGVSATATVDMIRGETSSVETYVGAAAGGAVAGVLGIPASVGKVGAFLGLPKTAMGVLTNPATIGALSSGIATWVGEELETATGSNSRTQGEIIADTAIDSFIGGILGFMGGNVKIPGLNSGRNSMQAVFFSGIRKLINGTGKMSLKTALKGFIPQYLESFFDNAITSCFQE